jgi:hypothetical protein
MKKKMSQLKAALTRSRPRSASSLAARRFADEGYVNLRGHFANVAEFNDVIGATVRENSAREVPEIHTLSAKLRSLIDACGFEERLAAMIPGRPRMQLLQSMYFPFSSNQASHSDKYLVSLPGRPHKRTTLCGLRLALDGSTRLNGAPFGWSGSHKVKEKPHPADYERSGDYSRDLSVVMVNNGLRPQFIHADPGDVIVWANDFVYGGASPVVPNAPLRSLVLHYGVLEQQ